MIETQTSNAAQGSLSFKQDHGKTVLKKPTKKNDDIPFPYVYFGFIGCFLLFYGEKLWYAFPSYEEHMRSSFVPDIEQAYLPLFAVFGVCPALYFWRGFLKNKVFAYFAEKWAGLTPGSLKHAKFCEQAWLAVHYTISTSLAFCVLHDKPWFPPVISEAAQVAIMGTREERCGDQKDLGIKGLYALQLGFYTLELITLLRSGHRRSDFMVYFFHHIYTIYLIGISWISFNHRIGSLVLILHDVGDIFLPIGKCYTYAEEYIRKTRTKAQYEFHKAIGMGFFVMFVIAFAIPRLVFFGTMVFQGLTKYPVYKCCGYDIQTKYCGECIFGAKGGKSDTPLLLVLGLLYPMHVYWFYLIAKMAIRLLLQPGKYDDVRSDDDEKND